MQEDGTTWSPPSTRRIACLVMTDTTGPNNHDTGLVKTLLSKVPTPAETVFAARRLALLLRHGSAESLGAALEVARRTLLQPFVATLRKDIAAVQASLELPWTTMQSPLTLGSPGPCGPPVPKWLRSRTQHSIPGPPTRLDPARSPPAVTTADYLHVLRREH